MVKNLPAMQEPQEMRVPSLGWEDPTGNPPQHSCLEDPMDRGAWQSAAHWVAKSWTCLKRLSTRTTYSVRFFDNKF